MAFFAADIPVKGSPHRSREATLVVACSTKARTHPGAPKTATMANIIVTTQTTTPETTAVQRPVRRWTSLMISSFAVPCAAAVIAGVASSIALAA
jgi:hypothetical protein